MEIKAIQNARYLESGAIDCDVLFDGAEDFIPYTVTPEDTDETGSRVRRALLSGRYEIKPFEVTPEMLEAAKAAKRQEIGAWRTEQESAPYTFEWGGHTWNGGMHSLARLTPVVMAAKSDTARDVMVWGSADNTPVTLGMRELSELAAAMAMAQSERNNDIYMRQREMKDELEKLDDLQAVRGFKVG